MTTSKRSGDAWARFAGEILSEEEMDRWDRMLLDLGPDQWGRAHEMLISGFAEIRRRRAADARVAPAIPAWDPGEAERLLSDLPEDMAWNGERADAGSREDSGDYVDGFNDGLRHARDLARQLRLACDALAGLASPSGAVVQPGVPEDREDVGCPVHSGAIHGGEAEDAKPEQLAEIYAAEKLGDGAPCSALDALRDAFISGYLVGIMRSSPAPDLDGRSPDLGT